MNLYQSNKYEPWGATILKWIFMAFLPPLALDLSLTEASLFAIIFLLIALLLLPPINEFCRSKFSFLRNKFTKIGLLSLLFIVGLFTVFNIPKNSFKEEDILVDYIKKNNTTDKSLLNISKLGEIGEMFSNGNYSIIDPHNGYITEQTDSINGKKIFVFNPKFNFNDDIYLKNDNKNGTLKDYIINFELDDKGKIISKKTILIYSKTGKVEFENNEVPNYDTFINADVVENQKLKKEVEN